MNCKDAMAALVASIETGSSLPHDVREHLKTCAHCRALLQSTRQVESALMDESVREPRVDESQLHATLRRTSRAQFLRRGAVTLLIAVAFAGLLAFAVATFDDDLNWRDGLMVFGLASVISALPALLFYVLIAVLHDRHGNRICKRIKEGRLLSGVCLGLSESTGIPLHVLRIAFVLLLFVKGIGLWLYIVLDLAMPVHPDDRVNLLRFRIRRWFQRRFAHADSNAR
jgi:phage shock protein PspC (stress-responsive transcriptional regulator)